MALCVYGSRKTLTIFKGYFISSAGNRFYSDNHFRGYKISKHSEEQRFGCVCTCVLYVCVVISIEYFRIKS